MTTEIDPKKLQRAKAYYETGVDAAQKRNFDYALQMLGDACRISPTNLQFRQGLRATQRLKYENDPAKVGLMAKTRLQPIRGQIKLVKSTSNWLRTLEVCEDAFLLNPWDVGVSMDAAEAALELGAPELAEWSLMAVADEAEDHVDYLRLMARVYESLGKWKAAIGCLDRVRHLDPTDQDVGSRINALSAKSMMARAEMEASAAKASAAKSGASNIAKPQPGDEIRVGGGGTSSDAAIPKSQTALSPEEQLKQRLQQDPQDIHAALELADIYKKANRWDEADRLLSASAKQSPNDHYLRQIHADTRIERLARALTTLDAHIAMHPEDTENISKRAEIIRKRDEFEIAEFQRRVAFNAADAESHFHLGLALARADRVDEAIASLQQARNNPQWKVRALTEAGKCFERIGSAKLAERNYTDALKAITSEDTVTFNDLHYRLGTLAERNGQLQQAEEHYNEVAANDYAYRDVAKRLRDLQSKI